MREHRRRIVFLTTSLRQEGAQTQLVRVAAGLQRSGWHVEVISLQSPEAFQLELAQAGVFLHSLHMSSGVEGVLTVPRLVQLLRRLRPHVLVGFLFHGIALARLAGWVARVPIVISAIRNEKFDGRFRDCFLRWTRYLSTYDVINSHRAAENLVARRVVCQSRSGVIPNGLDVEAVVSDRAAGVALRAQAGFQESDFLWLAAGRLHEQKDYPTLLRAFQSMIRETVAGTAGRPWLWIAGAGELEGQLRQLAGKLGLQERVVFLGFRNDLPRLLQAADAFVLSSAWEGMPNVVMEAMAGARPVVATRVGGVPELVVDGKNGLIVPPGDSRALAKAMRRLMQLSEEERKRMGERGRAYIESHYSMHRAIEKWDELCRTLLASRGDLQ